MSKFNAHSAPSRRSIIKGAGALAAGVAAPAFLRVRSAYAAYPERPVKVVVANTPGGPSDLVGRMITAGAAERNRQDLRDRKHRRRRRQYRIWVNAAHSDAGWLHHSCSRPMPGRSMPVFTTRYPTTHSRTSWASASWRHRPIHSWSSPIYRQKRCKEFVALARANPDKFNCATPPIGTTPQIPLEVLKIREKLPKLEDVVYKGGGDAHSGSAERNGAIELRLAAAGGPAHQGRHVCVASRSPAKALAGFARRSDHGGGWLQGFCALRPTPSCWRLPRRRRKS